MNEQPNKGGRPPNDSTPATGKIDWRVTMERKNRYVRAARAARLTLCAWLTRVCDAATGHTVDKANEEKPNE